MNFKRIIIMKKFIRTTVFAALTVTSTWLMPVAQADNCQVPIDHMLSF
jgi:hypothetical protein